MAIATVAGLTLTDVGVWSTTTVTLLVADPPPESLTVTRNVYVPAMENVASTESAVSSPLSL